MGLCFVFLDVTDKTSIGHFFALRYRRFLFEVNGFGAFNSVANTLCESSELVDEGCFPSVFIVTLYEVAVLLSLAGYWVRDRIRICDCDVVGRIGIPG